MASGLSKTPTSGADIIELMDTEAPTPEPRGSYKKQAA
jgi:hypothetical protein